MFVVMVVAVLVLIFLMFRFVSILLGSFNALDPAC